MIIPKVRLIRTTESTLNGGKFIEELAEHARGLLKEGRISDTNLGFGFNITIGKPKTLQGLLFPESELTATRNQEGLDKVKELIG